MTELQDRIDQTTDRDKQLDFIMDLRIFFKDAKNKDLDKKLQKLWFYVCET